MVRRIDPSPCSCVPTFACLMVLLAGIGIARAHQKEANPKARSGPAATQPGQHEPDPSSRPPVPSLFVSPPDPAVVLTLDNPAVVRSRAVGVRLPPFEMPEASAARQMSFELFDGRSIIGTIDRQVRRSASSYTWVGHLDVEHLSTFVLVLEQGVFAASLRAPRLGAFEVRPLGDELYALLEIDEGVLPPCGVGQEPFVQIPARREDRADAPPADDLAPLGTGCTDTASEIDVLVVYTPAARNAAGGAAAMNALIQLAIDSTNLSFANSLVDVQVNLVHAAETDYNESGDHLDLLRGRYDGVMDEVHGLRDQFKADLVSLITNTGPYQGVAYLLNPSNLGLMEDFAFSVTLVSAIGGLTFAHELGHNMGCMHDRANAGVGEGWASYAFGFQRPDGAPPFRTVMAYPCDPPANCPRVAHFSNPDVNYQSQPTGVPTFMPDAAHNALALNQTRGYVANFRKRVAPDCNLNGVPDDDDLLNGTSPDDNGNGIPDECEIRLFVDADAPPGGDGRTWATAFTDFQDALAAAGDLCATLTPMEIWVAAGTYTPDRGTGNRKAAFQLQNVAMYGGFAGGESTLADRAGLFDQTVLSGDLDGDDLFFLNSEDNSYHVVSGSWTDASALLDGFTITGGNAVGGMQPYDFGGGMYAVISALNLRNCTFAWNQASQYGGGVFTGSGGISLADCGFSDNSAEIFGGGMYSVAGSPSLVNCRFEGNMGSLGGGLHAFGGEPVLVNCLMTGNAADSGAGLSLALAEATVTNATISGNAAEFAGGGVYLSQMSTAIVTNTVLAGNTDDGGASADASAQLYNNPFFGPNSISVRHSAIQDDDPDDASIYPGVGNLDDDPLFLDAGGGDFHLQMGSPCIDAGTNLGVLLPGTDFDGNPRLIDDPSTPDCPQVAGQCGSPPIVDMGAFEFRAAGDEIQPPLPAPYPHDRRKNRYLSFDPNKAANAGTNLAFHVSLKSLQLGSCSISSAPCRRAETGGPNEPDQADCGQCSVSGSSCISAVIDCPAGETCQITGEACVNDQAGSVGLSWWVGPESPLGNGVHLLVSEPFRREDAGSVWPDVVHVGDCEIVPRATYAIRAVNVDTGAQSAELTVATIDRPMGNVAWWADGVAMVTYYCDGDERNELCDPQAGACPLGLPCSGAYPPPDGYTNFDDISAALALFSQLPGRTLPHITWVDMYSNNSAAPGGDWSDPPDFVANFADIAVMVLAFQGRPYPYLDPGDCPEVEAWP